MTRLARSEWEAYVPENVGKVRANHSTAMCSGGSPSMIVERKDNGWCSAFCFRCGGSGSYRPDACYVTPEKSSTHAGGVHRVHGYTAEVPTDCTTNWGAIPLGGRQWLAKGKLTPIRAGAHGVGWSDSRESLVLPVTQYGHHVGWVERRLDPKWVRNWAFDASKDLFAFLVPDSVSTNALVIVEDIVSAYRVHDAGYAVVALLGTYMKPSVFSAILNYKPQHVVIFLDADNSQVRINTRVIRKRLDVFTTTKVVETGSDPKYCTEAELNTLLRI